MGADHLREPYLQDLVCLDKNFLKKMLTPEEAYRYGYEDGFSAGKDVSFFEIRLDDSFMELPIEEQMVVIDEEILVKKEQFH